MDPMDTPETTPPRLTARRSSLASPRLRRTMRAVAATAFVAAAAGCGAGAADAPSPEAGAAVPPSAVRVWVVDGHVVASRSGSIGSDPTTGYGAHGVDYTPETTAGLCA